MKRTGRSSRKASPSRLGLLVLATLLTVAAPMIRVEAQAPARGGTLRIGWIPAAKTLDPHLSVEFSERYVCYLVFYTLVGLDQGFIVVPALARSLGFSHVAAGPFVRSSYHADEMVDAHERADHTA